MTTATFVLVHAAWADSSSWGPVIRRLQELGHHVVAAPLPLTSFDEDTASVNRVLERVPGPVVLAGHAYAGAVIGAVDTETVSALVYVAAIAPEEGETVAELFHRAPAHPQAPELTPDVNGLIWLPRNAFATAFAQDATPQEQAMLAAVQRPLSPTCLVVPAPRPAWKDVPSWFLIADGDRMIARETQHFVATRMKATVHVTDADHLPMVTQPDSVVDVLLAAAGSITLAPNPLEIVRELYARLTAGDPEGALALMADDIEWITMMDYTVVGRGPQRVLEGMLVPAMEEWEPYTLTPHEFICDGDKVVSVGRFNGTNRSTGKHVEVDYSHIWEVRDGKIARHRQFIDTAKIEPARRPG